MAQQLNSSFYVPEVKTEIKMCFVLALAKCTGIELFCNLLVEEQI
jgi:hypothetical protein